MRSICITATLSILAIAISFPIILSKRLNTKVPVKNCGTGTPLVKLSKLEIYPCEKDICIFKRGENVTIITEFMPKLDTKDLKITVSQLDWYFGLETIIVQGFNVCDKWNVTCPSESYKVQHGYFNHKVPESIPGGLKFWFKIMLIGDEKTLLCNIVPLEIR